MSIRSPWQFQSIPFSEEILKSIHNFDIKDLRDEKKKCIWINFAQNFSKMTLTPEIVESMSFETFQTIKVILSETLSQLSQETEIRAQEIKDKQGQYAALLAEERRLNQISEINRKKEAQVQAKKEEFRLLESSLISDTDALLYDDGSSFK